MRRIAMLAALALALSGCASVATISPGAPQTADPDAFQQRAQEVVTGWERSGMSKTWRLGFVPLSLDKVIVTGDPGFTGDSKLAFLAGQFTLRTPALLPPPPGQVLFPDGFRLPVHLVTAEDAYADMAKPNSNSCAKPCQPLTITQINLGTAKVLTTRGNATVPAWLFTIEGLKTPIAYMAVADKDVSKVPAPPAADYPALEGIVGAENVISVDGASVRFTVGVGSCDTDIKPLVYETADTVALGGSVTTPDGVCNAMLKFQPVTITLTKPVGDRALIDGVGGRPLTVSPFR
jgi:hypothetical protein